MNTFCKSLNRGLYRKNCFITCRRRNLIPKALFIVLVTIGVSLRGQDYLVPKPIEPTDPKGQKLPAGVPRTVDTNGNVINIDISFTTPMYRRAAQKALLQEANQIATRLQLREQLPITESNLTEAVIMPFGYKYAYKAVGNITTKNYIFYVSERNRLNQLAIAHYDQDCIELRQHSLPIDQLNTNEALQVASSLLVSFPINLEALNKSCRVGVFLNPFWNGLSRIGQLPAQQFVPIYDVGWFSRTNDVEHSGSVVLVELYLPEKRLLQLFIHDARYIMRKPVV